MRLYQVHYKITGIPNDFEVIPAEHVQGAIAIWEEEFGVMTDIFQIIDKGDAGP